MLAAHENVKGFVYPNFYDTFMENKLKELDQKHQEASI